jgi:hypothetical protein
VLTQVPALASDGAGLDALVPSVLYHAFYKTKDVEPKISNSR